MFSPDKGWYVLPMYELYPDDEMSREYVGILSGVRFVGRIGYTTFWVDKKSEKRWKEFLGIS